MKNFTKLIVFIAFVLLGEPAHSGSFLDGFSRGFVNNGNKILERQECEKTYSPSMCVQMEKDRKERAAEESHRQQTDAEMHRLRTRVNDLENINRNQ